MDTATPRAFFIDFIEFFDTFLRYYLAVTTASMGMSQESVGMADVI
jgi:hypothetical protein